MRHGGKARFEGTVQPWGNSLGIRITRPISELTDIGRGDKVAIEVTEEGGLLITRATPAKDRRRLPFSESELLADLTPHAAHADELPALLGKEFGG